MTGQQWSLQAERTSLKQTEAACMWDLLTPCYSIAISWDHSKKAYWTLSSLSLPRLAYGLKGLINPNNFIHILSLSFGMQIWFGTTTVSSHVIVKLPINAFMSYWSYYLDLSFKSLFSLQSVLSVRCLVQQLLVTSADII